MSVQKQDVSIINKRSASVEESRKRKRDVDGGDGVDELDRRPFTIRQSASNPFDRPLTLTPLHLISRASLPLAYLDISQTETNRFFSAHDHLLENAHHHGLEANVLVAREVGGRMFAVERVSWRKYAICRLAEWVREDHLVVHPEVCSGSTGDSKRRRSAFDVTAGPKRDGNAPWWRTAVVDVPVKLEDPSEQHRPHTSLPVLDMRPSKPDYHSDPRSAKAPATVLPDAKARTVPVDQVDPMQATIAQPPQDNLQELARHYMDALYVSRTSLNYFTKGPLSRARAAVNTEQNTSLQDLIDFLRQCILTSTILDKKYRDGIASIVKELPVRTTADSSPVVPKKKKKRKWKPKRDKGGLFVDEQDLLEKWWVEADHDQPPGIESADAVLRKRIARIRNRETFLQIILCLEVLALEASLSADDKKRVDSATTAPETQNDVETQQDDTQGATAEGAKPTKPRKKQDLPALVDTLLDKLTIWYSLESHSPAKTRTEGSAADHEQASENDELRSFCIDVIIPFYVSRIPHHANAVNKKLGGPSAPSPVKRKASSKNTEDTSRKPGEPATRQPPPEKKPRQPLSRVSSEVNTLHAKQRNSIPSLHRSSTDSDALLTHIKRENSESLPPLDSIPQAKPQRSSRTSLMSSLGRREVDLNAMSAANEAKARKKADVNEKLREAISTLKKPNRAAAVKEVAANADASFAKAVSRGKGPTAKGRASGAGNVVKEEKMSMVTATPSRHGRVVKVIKGTPYNGQAASNTHEAQEPPSSALVPSSSARLKPAQSEHTSLPTSTPAIPATGHRPRYQHLQPPRATNAVEETPSRGFARFMPAGLAREPGTLESPIASRKAAIESTPSKSLNSISFSFAAAGVAGTPLRAMGQAPVSSVNVREEVGNVPGLDKDSCGLKNSGDKGRSIYQTLGWDDDYEELA